MKDVVSSKMSALKDLIKKMLLMEAEDPGESKKEQKKEEEPEEMLEMAMEIEDPDVEDEEKEDEDDGLEEMKRFMKSGSSEKIKKDDKKKAGVIYGLSMPKKKKLMMGE